MGNYFSCSRKNSNETHRPSSGSEALVESTPKRQRRSAGSATECLSGSSSISFKQLPEDIGLRIFKGLDEPALLATKGVSRQFRHLTRLTVSSIKSIKIKSPDCIKKDVSFYGLGGLKAITLNPHPRFDFQDEHLRVLVDALKGVGMLGLQELALIKLNVADLSPLKELTHVRKFTLGACFEVASLDAIKDWSRLEFLQLSGLQKLSSLEPLAGCEEIRHFTISSCQKVDDLRPTQNWQLVETARLLGMSHGPVQINEGVKRWLSGLMWLDLDHCPRLGFHHIEDIRTAIETNGGHFSHELDQAGQ